MRIGLVTWSRRRAGGVETYLESISVALAAAVMASRESRQIAVVTFARTKAGRLQRFVSGYS